MGALLIVGTPLIVGKMVGEFEGDLVGAHVGVPVVSFKASAAFETDDLDFVLVSLKMKNIKSDARKITTMVKTILLHEVPSGLADDATNTLFSSTGTSSLLITLACSAFSAIIVSLLDGTGMLWFNVGDCSDDGCPSFSRAS